MKLLIDESGGVKRWVTWSVVAITLCVGGYFVYGAWTRADRPGKAAMLCVRCGYTTREELNVGDIPPLKCAVCGEEALHPAFGCPQCGTLNVWNANLGISGVTKCRRCGTEHHRGN